MKSHFNAFAETAAAGPEVGQTIKYYCGTLVFVPAKMEMHFKGFSFSCLESWLWCVDDSDVDIGIDITNSELFCMQKKEEF